MAKKIIGLAIAVLLLFSVVFLSGFGKTPNRGCIYKSDKTEFDINDVTLDFCFGLSNATSRRPDSTIIVPIKHRMEINVFFIRADRGYYQDGDGRKLLSDFTKSQVDFSNPHLFFIRNIDVDEFYSNEYYFESGKGGFNCDSYNGGKPDIYNHCEQITVPKEIFDNDSDSMLFCVRPDIWDVNEDGTETYNCCQDFISVLFYYKIEGQTVTIQSKEFDK